MCIRDSNDIGRLVDLDCVVFVLFFFDCEVTYQVGNPYWRGVFLPFDRMKIPQAAKNAELSAALPPHITYILKAGN